MKAANLVALFEESMRSIRDRVKLIKIDGRRFSHADHDECNETKRSVVRLDERNTSFRNTGNIALRSGVGNIVRIRIDPVLEVGGEPREEAPNNRSLPQEQAVVCIGLTPEHANCDNCRH